MHVGVCMIRTVNGNRSIHMCGSERGSVFVYLNCSSAVDLFFNI